MESERRLIESEYFLKEVLGSGGFSSVRKGVSKEDGDEVAVKTLKRQGFGFEDPREEDGHSSGKEGGDGKPRTVSGQDMSITEALLANEIAVMRRIVEQVAPHPNVVHLIDVFDDDVGVHLVLELCSGGELFDRIVSQAKYSEAMAAQAIKQIATGLSSLHKAHIVHRDLKPENCLYFIDDENSPLKIMDFGLSHVDGKTNPIVGMFGSIDYVAPEVLTQGTILPASDMWSVGVILFILLSGFAPFRANRSRDKKWLIMAGNYGKFQEDTWKTISASAKDVIAKLLCVDPDLRPTADTLLKHPWVTGDAATQEPLNENVFLRLQHFNARRKFRAAAFASILTSKFLLRTQHLKKLMGSGRYLSPQEIEELQGHFKRIATDGLTVKLPEFEKVLDAMDMHDLLPLAPRIFDLFDDNKDGCVDMREVVVGFASLKKSHGDDALKLCFELYDEDHSGFISKSELTSMLRALPEEYLPQNIMEPGRVDEMFERMDANSDGEISLEEFKTAIENIQESHFLTDALLYPMRHSPGLESPYPVLMSSSSSLESPSPLLGLKSPRREPPSPRQSPRGWSRVPYERLTGKKKG